MSKMCQTDQGSEPIDLISAASLGIYSAVEDILKNNLADVNEVNQSYWTALMYSANYGHYTIIRLLIKYDCNVDLQDRQGKTALMMAASNGHTRSIEALLHNGKADKTIKDFSGNTAYDYAKNNGHGNNKLIRDLLNRTADVSFGEVRRKCKGRSHSIPTSAPLVHSNQSWPTTAFLEKTSDEHNYIYNPCEPTAFSSNTLSKVWRPIRSQNQVNPIGYPSLQDLTPPDSSSSSCLSSSQSSTSSSTYSAAITAHPNFKQRPIGAEIESTPIVITSPMPKTLFHLLTRLELIQYLDVFESNCIDFYQFLTLTDEDFQNLGITCFGHRKKLLIAQKRYHESLDVNCTQESFFADFLLNERDSLNDRIRHLEQTIKRLENSQQN